MWRAPGIKQKSIIKEDTPAPIHKRPSMSAKAQQINVNRSQGHLLGGEGDKICSPGCILRPPGACATCCGLICDLRTRLRVAMESDKVLPPGPGRARTVSHGPRCQ